MGQMGQAASNPNTFAPNPSGFNSSEWATRFLGDAAKGAAQGLQNPNAPAVRQLGGPPAPAPLPQQSQINLPGQDWTPNQQKMKGNNLAFYGGQ